MRTRWPGAPTDDARLQAWIDDAETIIRATYPWIDDWITAEPPLEAAVALVVTRMVIRALANPFGIRQESVGDTSISYDTGMGLELTDADRALLDGYGPQAAFTIDQMPDESWEADPTIIGALVNRDGYAPGEVDPFDLPPPAWPDPAANLYSPTWQRAR